MIVSTRSNSYRYMLLLCMTALLLALAWPAAVAAQGPEGEPGVAPPGDPGAMPGTPGDPGTDPPGGTGPTTPTTPTDPPTDPPDPPDPPTDPPTTDPPTDPDVNGDKDDDGMMMMGPSAAELANRIVKHVATPAQLVMAGDGFQFFFIGPDGNTVSGPTIPSFADLAEMHPSGEWVSLLDAVNPLSGKQVYVDYIPKDMTIRVFTYYPDKGMDVNKPYIFNFGSDLAVNVEAW